MKDHIPLLNNLLIDCDVISGAWNGNDKGIKEDNAHIAHEIRDKVHEIIALMEELK
jgi:hypothetical protein